VYWLMAEETHSDVTCCRPVVLKAPGSIVLIPKSTKSRYAGHPDPQSGAPVKIRVPDVTVHVQPPQLCIGAKDQTTRTGLRDKAPLEGDVDLRQPWDQTKAVKNVISKSIAARNFSPSLVTRHLPSAPMAPQPATLKVSRQLAGIIQESMLDHTHGNPSLVLMDPLTGGAEGVGPGVVGAGDGVGAGGVGAKGEGVGEGVGAEEAHADVSLVSSV
jgi:hypothetical protein